MERLDLSGGKLFLTGNREQSFKVVEGPVLVFLIPIEEGRAGRRMLVHEAEKGEVIPAFCLDESIFGSWRFGLVALDTAQIDVLDECSYSLKEEFAHRIGIKNIDEESYDELILEKYNLNVIKEEGYIYSVKNEMEKTHSRTLEIIYSMFEKKAKQKYFASSTGNMLYDAVKALCIKQNIEISPIERIQESSGKHFRLDDITRISHFASRHVILEDMWYKKDVGSFLAITDAGKPMAVLCSGKGRYSYADPETKDVKRVDKAFIESLGANAVVFYRPFPNRKLNFVDLLKFIVPDIRVRDVFWFVVLSVIVSLIALVIPTLNRVLFDSVIPFKDEPALVQICFIAMMLEVGAVAFTIVKNFEFFRISSIAKNNLAHAIYERLIRLPQSVIRNHEPGDLITRVAGLEQIFEIAGNGLVRLGMSLVFSLVYLSSMFSANSQAALAGLVMVLITMAIIIWIGLRQIEVGRRQLSAGVLYQSWILQALSGIAKIRIANAEDRFLLKYLEHYTNSVKFSNSLQKATILSGVCQASAPIFYSMVIFGIFGASGISTGSFMAFMAAFAGFYTAALLLATGLINLNVVIPQYEKMNVILDSPAESDQDSDLPGEITGDIEVSNVSFAYGRDSDFVLKNISMHIKSGEYIGIVGSSGCGKSTLLKLLLGFERPSIGKVFYDKRDIDKVDKGELRKNFGVVLQDDKLIVGSIYENITITSPGAKMERVEEVVRQVGLEKDIAEMPMGLHTVITEGGSTISGGQRQRIQVARAIIGKPKVVFFDEATSALDNITQNMVTESLESLSATRIVIAHRLSTIMKCDRIFVMDAGEIIEEGNYQELMEKKGRFYQLAIRQMS